MKWLLRSTTAILFSILLLTHGYLKAATADEGSGNKKEDTSGEIRSFTEYSEYNIMAHGHTSASYNIEDYKALTFEMVYGKKITPPAFDLNMDISSKSLSELRLLRNTVYARHGMLFMDSVIRGYFNKFPWYQPVFWDQSFKISLSKDEQAFVARVKTEESLRLKNNKVNRDGLMMGNPDNIVNKEMFKSMPDKTDSLLKEQNFFLNTSSHEQLYNVYEENKYQGVPSYITTDLYADLLHVYYKHLMMSLEKYDLYPLAASLINGMYSKTLAIYNDKSTSSELKPALEFNLVYLAVAGNLFNQNSIKPPAVLFELYKKEYDACIKASEVGSVFLNDIYFDHSQLKVRGSYAEDKSLGFYFQGVKWLVTAPSFYQEDIGLKSSALLALVLQDNRDLLEQYNRFENIISAVAGEGDNLSPMHILKAFNRDKRFAGAASLADKDLMTQLRNQLMDMDPERMPAKGGTAEIAAEIDKPRILFFPSRYNFDGYILQNLINPLFSGGGARLYPKGLDIFATFGNSEAKRILFKEYKEAESWPGYVNALKKMEEKFTGFNAWDQNLFNKRMDIILGITKGDNRYPDFMKTGSWQRRELISSLAAWTEVKNELILYQKQPSGAEAGEGGLKPPDPVTPGYVEPKVPFWAGCLDLLNMTHTFLAKEGFSTTERKSDLARLYIMAEDLLAISRKELKGEMINNNDFKKIEGIGAEAEYLAKSLKGEWDNFDGMGLAADVYTYYTDAACLEEAVGNADIIWCMAEINGLLYLTRGATFSYYEFKEPLSSRLTDEEWRERLTAKRAPERPVWTKNLYAPKTPEVNTSYGDTSYPVSGKWSY
jgi:hypothetical protein